jgi:hypothetical protein
MQEGKVAKKITRWKPISSRLRGGPEMKWEDGVMQDIQTMKIKNWRKIAMN